MQVPDLHRVEQRGNYLRLAIFFGCLGIFMYLFRGEMSNRTLHFWFLAPARREVLLAGNDAAGLIALAAILPAAAPCSRLRPWSGRTMRSKFRPTGTPEA